MAVELKFRGGFGAWHAENGNASIRRCGFGRVIRFQVWVNGGLPRCMRNTYAEAKHSANRIFNQENSK